MKALISGIYYVTLVMTSGISTLSYLRIFNCLLHVLKELSLPLLGKLEELYPFIYRVVDNLIVDVCYVHYQLNGNIAYLNIVPQVVPEYLENHVVAGVIPE